jgi:hypothetical protein
MKQPHSCWPLFSSDLALARSWLEPQLQKAPVATRTAHQALSLGLVAAIETMLERQDHLEAQAIAQLSFRLARLQSLPNPYNSLIPASLKTSTERAIAESLWKASPLKVSLNGGIGDHLEALSVLIPWAQGHGISLALHTSQSRGKQLSCVLQSHPQLRLGAPWGLPVMALRGWIKDHAEINYSPWLNLITTAIKPSKWVCCWRAAGAGDRFSAHCRSVPFYLVIKFYRQLLNNSPLAIIDLSDWQPWEKAQLRVIGVQSHDPSKGDLADLAKLVRNSQVISIDTALAHLCAALGHPATVLLPLYADERWVELHKPNNSYGRWLRLERNIHFGDWQISLDRLLCILLNS